MTGPDGEQHWCMVSYKTIDAENSFTAIDSFCDEHGALNAAFPSNHWTTKFIDHTTFTEVIVTLRFDSLEDMRKIIEMGFKQGFTMGLTQLQEVLDTPAANTKKMTWQVQIAAPREKVWKKIFDKLER